MSSGNCEKINRTEFTASYGIRNVELAGTYNLPADSFKEMLSGKFRRA